MCCLILRRESRNRNNRHRPIGQYVGVVVNLILIRVAAGHGAIP